MLILFGILLTALFLLRFFCRHFNYYKLALRLPYAKKAPLIGHALNLWVDKDELLDKILEIIGEPDNKRSIQEHGVLAVWIGPMAIVLVHDLQDIEQILTSRDLTRKSYQYKFFEPWLGQGLFTASGPHWYSHRKLITPAFHFKILEKFIPIFNANIDIYLRKLDEKVGKGSFNIENYIAYLSLDIIAETAMDAKINAQKEESPYAQKVKDMTETILLRGCRLLYYSDVIFSLSSLGRRQKRSKRFIDNFINDLVKRKKEERNRIQLTKNNKNNSEIDEKERVALMDVLLETQNRSSHFTDKDILDEVNTFMFGGHDTITSCINFTLYLLSKHPTIQEEVLREIESVIGEEKFTLSNLQQLKYLERVIKESLRILPVGPFMQRAAEKDIKLRSGYVLPAGCTIIMMIYALHRNPEYFPNPEQFDPDRFLPENCLNRHPYAYLPFSAGPRNCIGQKFALLEMKAIIAATIRRYKLLPSEDIKPVIHIILRSANGINLILERRKSSSNASNHPQLQRT
ncbi:unnamed protein product [Nezara viridula]|uniref:Cytochrome P450 n=1 Tax=Nezara viridula TaxID=85310 RepID=A0A9P0MRY7_NEZVI|nr:unnamed protein product [Nezara viridula]